MLNQIIIHGRLTKDPELRTTQSGKEVCTYTVACERDYKNGDKQADFFPCVTWGGGAAFVSQYFKKGQEILIKGRLQERDYTDKEGVKRKIYEIVTDAVNFCGKKEGGASTGTTAPFDDFEEIADDEDVPF